MKMLILMTWTLLCLLDVVAGDYQCLCNHGGGSIVFPQPFVSSKILGLLGNGVCKPTYPVWTTANWTAIQFNNQMGFVSVTPALQHYNCSGTPSSTDVLTTHHGLVSATTGSTTPTTRATTASTAQCPFRVSRNRFLRVFKDHCYEFNVGGQLSRTWPDAEKNCQEKGGHLVSISSMEEQNFIFKSLADLHFHQYDGVWIGLTDRHHEGHWTWTSGERVNFTYWALDQPGALGALEDCVMIDMNEYGHWGDYSCEGLLINLIGHAYICEYNKI